VIELISNLLHEVYHYGIDLWVEDDKLKYRAGEGGFPEHLKEAVKQHKLILMDRLRENEMAFKDGWDMLQFGESYSKRVSYSSEIYIFRESDGLCSLWRGYWRQDEPEPYQENTLTKGVGFHEAFRRGNDYIQWLNSRRKKAV
jgi:hypothetical protein